jgi:hypothetical protein
MGIEDVLQEIKDNGFTGISLNTAYHAGRFLQVRSQKRKTYFPEDGTLYYPVNMEHYKNLLIQPQQAQIITENPTFWEDVFKAAQKLELNVSGWTVCMHNTRIGVHYPSVTVRNAYGDPCYYNLCPSNKDARAYIKAVTADLTATYPFYSLELESLNYMGFSHEFHHEKDGYGLSQRAQFLLSLCFCDSCKERAQKDGLNISEAQATVRKWIDEILSQDIPENDDEKFLAEGIDGFKHSPEVYEYLRWRPTAVTSLAKEIRDVVNPKTKIYFLSLLTPSLSWLFGVDFAEVGKVTDGIVVCCYDSDASQVDKDMEQSRQVVKDTTSLFTGLRLFYPEVHNEAELKNKMQHARNSGSDGFILYNYGLIPKGRMLWAKNSIDSLK